MFPNPLHKVGTKGEKLVEICYKMKSGVRFISGIREGDTKGNVYIFPLPETGELSVHRTIYSLGLYLRLWILPIWYSAQDQEYKNCRKNISEFLKKG